MTEGRPATPNVLARIVAHERGVVREARDRRPVAALHERPEWSIARRSLRSSLIAADPAIIAECKRRSPSKGVLRDPYDPVSIARSYEAAGAAGLSVLTNEEFFGGTLEHLAAVRGAVDLPILRKDFVIDPYQLHEARAFGADAVLLIAAVHPPDVLLALYTAALEIGLDVLVEVHDDAELEGALRCEEAILGVNNRDLRTFHTDLATCERLSDKVPRDRLLVAESGVRDASDVERLRRSGIRAFLVGEAFMKADDPGRALRELAGGGGA